MARCYYLDYESTGMLYSQGYYFCKLCSRRLTETEVKFTCNPDSGEHYKNCPVYRSR